MSMNNFSNSLICPNIPFSWFPILDTNEPFVAGLSEYLQEECHSVMLHDKMNISRLMVHARRVEEAWFKRKSRDSKR